jgi:hypothetical protein
MLRSKTKADDIGDRVLSMRGWWSRRDGRDEGNWAGMYAGQGSRSRPVENRTAKVERCKKFKGLPTPCATGAMDGCGQPPAIAEPKGVGAFAEDARRGSRGPWRWSGASAKRKGTTPRGRARGGRAVSVGRQENYVPGGLAELDNEARNRIKFVRSPIFRECTLGCSSSKRQ